MTYRLIDHTADFGVEVFGSSPARLFENAAHALFDLITDPTRISGSQERQVMVDGTDWPDLMVNWLRELLYLWNGESHLLEKAAIMEIAENGLLAKITCGPYVPGQHPIKGEIKAVTYHQIRVEQEATGWMARIIFDV